MFKNGRKYGEKELSPSTLRTYTFNLKNHILPRFGHMQMDKRFEIYSGASRSLKL
ncbi:N-terminal phage integrase SAM-like domain-containing protein [Chengkuizengella sediminis]|uniref:N-terminal phage integrase SAM-like domain-containing protein n=1 Tax=Chengkuizengella sediminis TaxID=1885917 RepID=UPI001F0EFD1F|nr:N-terminal phage integrase SAM-like domain-containing protein [Chengkuizengella sediminis]